MKGQITFLFALVGLGGCAAMDEAGHVRAPGDWAAQFDLCHEKIAAALAQAGASLDDVVRRRSFTIAAYRLSWVMKQNAIPAERYERPEGVLPESSHRKRNELPRGWISRTTVSSPIISPIRCS